MGTRKDEFSKKVINPAKRFLSWKSEKNAFIFWDKNEKKEVDVKLPIKFVVLKMFNTVKGYSPKYNAEIWANEVENLRTDELRVGYFENGKIKELFKGKWNDIKDKVAGIGGKFSKSVYALDENGDIINLQLFGSGLNNFFDLSTSQMYNLFVTAKKSEQKKNGGIKYNSPVWEFGEQIDDKTQDLANKKWQEVVDYYKEYSKQVGVADNVDDKPLNDIEDVDLPF
jgi:hypothetical protein